MHTRRTFLASALVALAASSANGQPLVAGATFPATDSLDIGGEESADAQACLDAIRWKPGPFTVTLQPPRAGWGEWLVRYPSARPIGDSVNDLVSMEWYPAVGRNGSPIKAPAMVVIHESGKGMVAGRVIARGLRLKRIHTFMIHLPGYGERRSAHTADIANMLPALPQAVADVRRGRDAVAALPFVDAKRIGVQGTSLGGFVAAAVAGLDQGFQKAFVLLAGGRIADVILTGKKDAAGFRRQLEARGITVQQIRDLAQTIEPLRIAHRVNARETWVFAGKYDDVVPPSCCEAFAERAKLPAGNYRLMPVGHYTAALMLPLAISEIGDLMKG